MSKSPKLEDKQLLSKLAKDFHDLVSNKEVLRASVESFLQNTIDELTLGIIFDLHRKYKTKSYDIDLEEDEGDDDEAGETDFFVQHDIKKTQECVCPNCDRAVAATRFAPHLETCMGMGRNRFRNATRRVNSANNSTTTTTANNNSSTNHPKERETTSANVPSDDDDDMDWNPGSKRGAIKREYKKKRNGSKKLKTGGTPKKASDSSNIDMDEEDDLSNLRELLQDHSNSSSPADSVSSSHSNSSRKKERTKNKKNKRDKSSPSSSISAE